MATLKLANTAQRVKSIVFEWNFGDSLKNTLGNLQDFGSVNTAAVAGTPDADSKFAIATLPMGAMVVGGAITRSVAFDTLGYDITVGDVDNNSAYFATADLKGTGSNALVPTGIPCTTANGCSIIITVANDDVCTTGKAKVRVDYIVPGRAEEVTAPGT
ncbi:MAG: hypothetical protein MUQ56_11090 [Thermoleophilia bacterium]|nr:hypothetical protein [Thermoleophilia bacterium]